MLTMYSTSWCGYCHRLKSQLDREGIGYDVVDIERDPAAAEFVMSVNRGNQTARNSERKAVYGEAYEAVFPHVTDTLL